MNAKAISKIFIAITAGFLIAPSIANAQKGAALLMQSRASVSIHANVAPVGKFIPAAVTPNSQSDLIEARQVKAMARKTFPNMSQGLDDSELFSRIQSDPTLTGNLRGRLAEEGFFKRNPSWKPVRSNTAPQNDGWRWVNGVVGGQKEGVQIKVLSDWKGYIRAMQKDDKAEYFAIPDDQYDLVKQDLETRRLGAVRGGLTDKATKYANEQQRLLKLGQTFEKLDYSIMAAGLESRLIASK
jgi:hypothetical protein